MDVFGTLTKPLKVVLNIFEMVRFLVKIVKNLKKLQGGPSAVFEVFDLQKIEILHPELKNRKKWRLAIPNRIELEIFENFSF